MEGSTRAQPAAPRSGRERILEAAYELFSSDGIKGVGVDAIIERAGVAKMTLYRNFASKEELVMAFLRLREDRWTVGWLQGEVTSRTDDPALRLLAIFDVFDPWFRSRAFEGCSFINVLLETPEAGNPIRKATVRHLANIRAFLREQAEDAGVRDPDDFAAQWHILMKGSIVAAQEGDTEAARRAQGVGALLLEREGIELDDAPALTA